MHNTFLNLLKQLRCLAEADHPHNASAPRLCHRARQHGRLITFQANQAGDFRAFLQDIRSVCGHEHPVAEIRFRAFEIKCILKGLLKSFQARLCRLVVGLPAEGHDFEPFGYGGFQQCAEEGANLLFIPAQEHAPPRTGRIGD
ncbi:MAG: hypothetical protein BWY09_02977 [Candidatus Hydrogenedentes bacterium ADurb.Bin179]|nr:MAG: hypothetical protein BWY09_02977 [Candidatus Hydrogenedentes bacterium ADurb.Bin179]